VLKIIQSASATARTRSLCLATAYHYFLLSLCNLLDDSKLIVEKEKGKKYKMTPQTISFL
jgi:hypothetical protein